MKPNNVGIVVIGRNEGGRLIDCLISLQLHTGNVIYVDSGSEDDSVTVAKKFDVAVVQLNAFMPFTAARARNEGLAALLTRYPECKYVQFIDGDCQLNPDWIEKAVRFIAGRPDVAVVCGRRRERYPEKSIYNRFCDIEWDTPIGEALACGGDALMRVEAFRSVKGFSSALIAGEEPELCERLRANGWRVWRLAAEMTYHDASMLRFRQWWLRAVRSGYAEAEISWSLRSSGMAVAEKRATISAALWGGLLPLGIFLGAVANPACLALLLIYPIQIARIAVRREYRKIELWLYALFIVIAKFAQLRGVLMYCWRLWRKEVHQIIEYK